MASISKEYIRDVVSEVASTLDVTDWRYTEECFEIMAQNYFGVLVPVCLHGKINGSDENFPLVLKLAPTDDRYRISGAIGLFFAREVFAYSTLLRRYGELQCDLNLSPRLTVPKCYFSREEHCKEALVLEDMRSHGYSPFAGEDDLDSEHVFVSLKALATFHAMSFIVKKLDPQLYEKASNVCVPLTEGNNARFIEILKNRLTMAVELFVDTQYEPVLQYLLSGLADWVSQAYLAVKKTVICHGDIWKENFLFLYEDRRPKSACLIDFQTARICSPAFDVLYLIITSTNSVLRQRHYTAWIDYYYKIFAQVIREAGLDPQMEYCRSDLDVDLELVAPATLIVANTALWLYYGMQQTGHVRSKRVCLTDDDKLEATLDFKMAIMEIIEDYHANGYLIPAGTTRIRYRYQISDTYREFRNQISL